MRTNITIPTPRKFAVARRARSKIRPRAGQNPRKIWKVVISTFRYLEIPRDPGADSARFLYLWETRSGGTGLKRRLGPVFGHI